MPKSKLLILDANVVIELHEIGLWAAVVEKYEVHLSRIVAEEEVRYFHGSRRDEVISLAGDLRAGRVHVFDVETEGIRRFRNRFEPTYFERLDPGEAESLAFLLLSDQSFLISSADSIVYKVLGNLRIGEQGISLEEVLRQIGLGRSDLDWQYTKRFRDKYTSEGQRDSITGYGEQRSPE